jgi:predicted lipid-binding transport protein (Tim44 family)
VAESPEAAERNNRHPLLRSPAFWGVAVGTLVAVFNLGLSGLFWVLFFGFAAFGIAWLFLTTAGRERLASFLDNFEE